MKTGSVRPDESGQAIVLFVLALVALAGFAALALDGGNLFTEQRRAQAAADNAVMAAAFAEMNSITVTTTLSDAALAEAATNGYSNDSATNWVDFNRPPTKGPYAGNDDFMEVVITQTVSTALAHLVYGQNPIPLTVWAVAHGRPQQPVMDGYALATLKGLCDGSNIIGMQGRGGGSTGHTALFGGGVFVNATCDDALEMSGSGESLITDGHPIDVVGCATPSDPTCGIDGSLCASGTDTGCNLYPAPTLGVPPVTQDPLAGLQPPTCGPARSASAELSDDNRIRSGTYTDMDLAQHVTADTVYFEPGIYCLSGQLDPGNNTIVGHGILLYLTTTTAMIDVSGNGGVQISAPSDAANGCIASPEQEICRYRGLLVYKPQGLNECSASNHEIDFTGNGYLDIVGTIYAPESLVRYGGNGAMVMTGQTLAACVKFNGNGAIDIFYDPDLSFSPPPNVRLDE